MIHGLGGSPLPPSMPRSTQLSKATSFQRIGTGKRINSAADDAANLATVQQFLAMEAGSAQGQRNLRDGQSLVRVAEGSLGGAADLVNRMRELAIQAGNGSLNDQDRAMVQQEFDQLAAEVDRIAASTEFNGRKLLDGNVTGNGAIDLHDGMSGEHVQIEIAEQSAASLGLAGLDVADSGSLQAIDQAIDSISRSRASLGAIDRSLDAQVRNLQTAGENMAAARSRIGDADLAVEVSRLTQAQILEQSQLALRVNGRVQAESALRLLS